MHILQTIFVQPFLNLLIFILAIIPSHDFGLSVIILTLIIRFALWPLTAKQLHSQRKMQALQPEIAKLKQKAKGNKQLESQMLMELYKEKEISPFSACLPLLLQFPFLIALYFVFREATQHPEQLASQLYPFVANMSYVQSIINNPSSFNPTLFGIVSMVAPSIVLAILAGLTQFIQVKMLTPKVEGDTKDPQAQATKFMNLTFPLLTVFIAWRLPAALPLYWTVTNVTSIIQQKLIMSKEVDKMEEVKIVKKNPLSNVKKIAKPRAKNTKQKK